METIRINRRHSIGLFAAGLVLPSGAWAAEPPLLPPAPLPEAEFTPGDGSADLAGMEDDLRRMTAPVMINGEGPFDFVVDTGTNRSVISAELATTLNLPMGRKVQLHGISGAREAGTVSLKTFGVGAREASKLSLPVISEKTLRGHGILGVDGLKNQRVVLDLPNQRLQIEASTKTPRHAGDSVIKARRRFGQLTVVETDLDGVQVSVLLDTGSETTMGNSALRRALGGRRPDKQAPGFIPVSIQGATGDVAYGEYGAVPVFHMGPLTIRNLRIIYADLHPFALWGLSDKPAMLMGMDIMRYFEVLSLDYGRNEVRFTLPAQPYIDPVSDPKRT